MKTNKLVAVLLLMATLAGFPIHHFQTTPVTPPAPVKIRIEPGSGVFRMATTLADEGIISSRILFLGLTATKGRLKRLQAGTYFFEGERTPSEVIDILFKGKIHQIRFTVPEGSDIFELAGIVSSTGIVSRPAFISAAKDPATVKFFGLEAPTMEGFLYPDTYFITEDMTAFEIIAKMFGRFSSAYTAAAESAGEPAAMSRLEIVTLASLIEKEAVVKEEKPIIASVFHNRLRRRMRLQSDPTAVYGLEGFTGPIRPHDLKNPSPYNTYLHNGLPPGPICSPHQDSIAAAFYPARTNYLYFVATGDGRHIFSRTLKEHNRAVAKIRRSNKS